MAAPEIVNDKYEVLRPLGQGASGVVHVVRDLEDGIDYVMKRSTADRRAEGSFFFCFVFN